MGYTPTNNPYVAGDPYMYNMNWIVKKIKEAIKLYEPLAADFKELEDYVNTYFENLDVEQQIQDAIQDLIDSGALSQMILDAFNELDERVDVLESRTPDDFVYNYTKVGEIEHPNGAPVLCCYNPVANCVTYLTQTDNGYSKIGYLASDNITPATTNNIAFTHANDIDYCNALNVILAVDIVNNSPVIYKINPASLLPLGTFDAHEWTGGYVSAIACDNVNNYIYLFGESADGQKYHAAKMNPDGTVIKQFDILLSISSGATQGGVCIDDTFSVLYTPTGDYNGDGCVFYNINFEKEVVKCSRRFNIKGEVESATLVNGDLFVYGFTPAENDAKSFAECVILSQAPRAPEAMIYHIDETATANGDGSSATPFNNLNSALYTVLNSPIKAKYMLRFDSDISKYANNLENYTPVNMFINMNGKTWNITKVIAFPNDSNIYIFNGIIVTTTGNVDFQRSNITLRQITLNRDTTRVSMRFYSCTAYIYTMTVNLNVTETTYAPLFVTEQSIVSLNATLGTTTDVANHLALVEQGVIINTKAITGLTTPVASWAGGVVLGV